MLIALNIVMAGLVVIGIVTLLARSIVADSKRSTATTAARAHTARTRARVSTSRRPAGAHF